MITHLVNDIDRDPDVTLSKTTGRVGRPFPTREHFFNKQGKFTLGEGADRASQSPFASCQDKGYFRAVAHIPWRQRHR